MTKLFKFGLTMVLALTVAGCFHTEVNGPAAQSSVVITELRNGSVAQENIVSLDEADSIAQLGQQAWDDLGDLGQMVVMANFFVDKKNFVNSRLYLVTVSGGIDTDADDDGLVDDQPAAIGGTWHAIMKGSHLRSGGVVISPITEALYQSVKDEVSNLDDAGVMALLAANTKKILTDVNDTGNVNYRDALAWTELAHDGKYKLDLSAIKDLGDAIISGASEGEIEQLSAAVLGEEPGVDALQFFTDNISMPIVQTRCINCHTAGGIAPNSGARLVLVTNSNPNNLTINHDAFIELGDVLGSTDLSDYVTGKASAQISHGGGRQIMSGTQDLLNLETYLNLLE